MTELPRLAVFHDQHSTSIWMIYEAAHEWSRILWVVGWSPDVPPIRMLSRFGDVVDVTGMSETQAVAHLVGLRPDGVIVFNDSPIRFAAAVAEQLDLPFHSTQSALLLTDKLAQRTALQEAGILMPDFVAVHAGHIGATVPFPAVLKPRGGSGSRDTYLVENRMQVADYLAQCDPDEMFILEEWLPDRNPQPGLAADLVSVESVIRDGVIAHIMVTGRFPLAPPFRETGSFMPSTLGPGDRDDVMALASAASHALDIRHGLLHTEVKMTPAGPRLVEVNGRLGGGISEMATRIGGPSLLVWATRLALGQDIGPPPVFLEAPIAFFRWIVAPPSATTVASVSGVDALTSLRGVDQVQLNRQPGDAVDSRLGSPEGHVVRIDGTVMSHDDLWDLIYQKIPSTLQLTWSFTR